MMEKVSHKIVELSCHKKGTHSMQTLVVELETEEEITTFLGLLKQRDEDEIQKVKIGVTGYRSKNLRKD